MNAPTEWQAKVWKLTDEAERASLKKQYKKALAFFEEAYALVPEAQRGESEAMCLLANAGELCFRFGHFREALGYFERAQACDGGDRYTTRMRIGQSLFELGELARAKGLLLDVLATNGDDAFKFDAPKYLAFAKES